MLTVLMQGQITKWTEEILQKYISHQFIEQIVLSTWEGENIPKIVLDNNIKVVYNKKPDNSGKGNRNMQIVSSLGGVREVKTEYCIKVRTDMYLPELANMTDIFVRNANRGQIYTLSLYPFFPFHPRDHVFFGTTTDIIKLFTIPLDNNDNVQYNEYDDVRSETYICMWYYALFNSEVYKFANNPYDYLTDKAPKRKEALKVYHQMITQRQGFIPFPEVAIWWPKYYPNGYPTAYLQNLYGEIYGNDK